MEFHWNNAGVADLVRDHVLYKFGGVYFDTDIIPIQSLYKLRTFLKLMNDDGDDSDSDRL